MVDEALDADPRSLLPRGRRRSSSPTTRSPAWSTSLDDRSPATSTPRSTSASARPRTARFTGVGIDGLRAPARAARREVYDGSPAKRAGLVRGDLIVERRRALAEGPHERARVEPDQGPAGHRRDAHRLARRQGAGAGADARADLGPGRRLVAARGLTARRSASSRLAQFSSGAHGEVYAALKKLEKRGRRRLRARPARQRRRPRRRGAARRQRVPRRAATIVTTRGRTVPSARCSATGDPVAPKTPLVVLVDARHRVGVGDRRRRAAGPRPRDSSSARGRSARASSRRSSSSPTAARSTSPPASTSRPTGATSAARGVQTGAGLKPDVARQRRRRRPRPTRRCEGAGRGRAQGRLPARAQ